MSINYFAQATNFESAMSALSASILASDGRDWSRLNTWHIPICVATLKRLVPSSSTPRRRTRLWWRSSVTTVLVSIQFERCRVRLAQFASRDFGKEVHPSDML